MHRALCVLFLSLGVASAWDLNDDLLAASRRGEVEAIRTLLEKGANVEAKTPYGQTPLYLAAMSGHLAAVDLLLSKGANPDVKDTFYKAPILAFAVQRKHEAVVKAPIGATREPLDEPLAEIAQIGNASLVQAILDRKKVSQAGLDRAYEGALEAKQADVAALLKSAGGNEPSPPVVINAAVLRLYEGTYRSEQPPIDVKVSVKDGKLILQVAGQPEIIPRAKTATLFEFSPARMQIEFESNAAFTVRQPNSQAKFKRVASAQ